MKKTILAIAVALMSSGAIMAQETAAPVKSNAGTTKQQNKNATPAEKAKHGANWATKNLGLNDDQKTKWEAAALERITANTAIREKMKGSTTPEERKTMKAEMKANHDKFDATANSFLTDEHKAKWTKLKADKQAKAKNKKAAEDANLED